MQGAVLAASFEATCRDPKHPRCRDRIDSPSPPPGDFVSETVVVAVMGSAQGYGELVAHLTPHCAELSEPKVVGVSGASSADKTGLRCHEFEMGLIALSARLADRKLAFLNFGGSGVGLKIRWRWRLIVVDAWLWWDRRRNN
jgi:hypothetical protein